LFDKSGEIIGGLVICWLTVKIVKWNTNPTAF